MLMKLCIFAYTWCIIILHLVYSKSVTFTKPELKQTHCVKPNLFQRKPLVLIPGVLGSRMEVKINRTKAKWPCKTQSDWTDIWLNLQFFIPGYVNCWVEDLRMVYDNVTKTSGNSPGVNVRTPYFGSTEAFEYLDKDTFVPGSKYFAPLVKHLVCNLGYTRMKDLRGAPFDWRVAPYGQTEYFANLTDLVEETFYSNNNKKVVLLGHSLGNLFVYYFLHTQTQSWKEKFIDSFFSISGPYTGAVKSLKALISGETEGHPFILPKLKIREVVRTCSAFSFLVPRPDMWPNDKKLLVVTLERNYTIYDYHDLFQRIGCKGCWDMWNDNKFTLGLLQPPSVPVHCIYGSQLPTAEALIYDEDLFPDQSPSLVDGSGDGTVNVWSASACLQWKNKQKHPVYGLEMPGNDHVEILWNATLHKYIERFLLIF